jgi:hypothetical protein
MFSIRSLAAAGLVLLTPAFALADGDVTCVRGAFADHVEQGKPAGDSAAIATANRAVYGVDIANGGDATQITLVWKLDGAEVQRQTLDVGHSPHWHTWGMRPLGHAKTVDVDVLDASGKVIQHDSMSVER